MINGSPNLGHHDESVKKHPVRRILPNLEEGMTSGRNEQVIAFVAILLVSRGDLDDELRRVEGPVAVTNTILNC